MYHQIEKVGVRVMSEQTMHDDIEVNVVLVMSSKKQVKWGTKCVNIFY